MHSLTKVVSQEVAFLRKIEVGGIFRLPGRPVVVERRQTAAKVPLAPVPNPPTGALSDRWNPGRTQHPQTSPVHADPNTNFLPHKTPRMLGGAYEASAMNTRRTHA